MFTLATYSLYAQNEGPFGNLSEEEFAAKFLTKETNLAGETYTPYTDGTWKWS